jgi:hypothetical protein
LPLVARLRLGRRQEPARFPADLLRRRRTSRRPYDGRPVDERMLAELSAIAAAVGHRASFSSDPVLVDWVLSLNADTLFADIDEDDRREEIGRWTHPSGRTARARGDGFSPRSLGFPAALLRLFLHRHRLFRPRPVRALVRRLYLRTMRGTATVGWIAGPWTTPADHLDAGRMLLRLWLALTARGLHLQRSDRSSRAPPPTPASPSGCGSGRRRVRSGSCCASAPGPSRRAARAGRSRRS